MKIKLILAHKDEKPQRVLNYVGQADSACWLYMGRNYGYVLTWKSFMPGAVRHVQIGRELQYKAKELRRPFVDFISEAGSSNNAFTYWSSMVFEKNTVASPLFLYYCYLEVLKDYLERNEKYKTIVIVSESWCFLETVKDNFISPGIEVVSLNNAVSKTMGILQDYFRIIKHSVFFANRCFWAYIASRLYCFLSKGKDINPDGIKNKLIILRTWVLSDFFDKEGNFKNVYMPSLSDWLKNKGYDIKIIPLIYIPASEPGSVLKAYRKILLSLRKTGNNFLVPWDYLKLSDIFSVFRMCMGQLWLRFNTYTFRNWNSYHLLNAERRKFAMNARGLECALHYLLFKRLSEKKVAIERIIYTFENMLTEKLFLMGAKTFYPETRTIGFQHSVLFPLKLDLYISRKEIADSLLPDKIVCSGKIFRDLMAKEYYPAEKLEIGPALRFAHIFTNKTERSVLQQNCVLVACPGYENELIELLFNLFTALKDEDVLLWIKPKPDKPMMDVINKITKITAFPPSKMKIVSGALSELISRANIMVTIASGAIFDGIASGVPVLRIKREGDLDFDPMDCFDFNSKRDFIAYTTADIKREVIRALNLSREDKEILTNYGKQFVEENFSPISEETFSAFLG